MTRDPGRTRSIAFVTKSYEPDRTRCELLCRSIELLAPAARHWIIVDRQDLRAFRALERANTRVVTTEELLPRRAWKLDLHRFRIAKNVWVSWGTRPMRGWLVQQLAKLALMRLAPEDVFIHADSDTALIRRFDADALTLGAEAVPIHRIPDAIDERLPTHIRWHRFAEEVLGLEPRPLPLPDYIGPLIPWHRETACELLDEITRRSRGDWMQTLANGWHLSEYTLYGRYADDVVGRTSAPLPTCPVLCHSFWGPDPITNAELEEFIDGSESAHIGVLISSNVGMDPASYGDVLERRWQRELDADAGAQLMPEGDVRDS
jgi:hypothetical protein